MKPIKLEVNFPSKSIVNHYLHSHYTYINQKAHESTSLQPRPDY